MFLGLDVVLYIWGYLFIVYITLVRFIVLYFRCRVKPGYKFVCCLVLCNILFCFHCTFGLLGSVPNLWGASPLWLHPLRIRLTLPGIETKKFVFVIETDWSFKAYGLYAVYLVG